MTLLSVPKMPLLDAKCDICFHEKVLPGAGAISVAKALERGPCTEQLKWKSTALLQPCQRLDMNPGGAVEGSVQGQPKASCLSVLFHRLMKWKLPSPGPGTKAVFIIASSRNAGSELLSWSSR